MSQHLIMSIIYNVLLVNRNHECCYYQHGVASPAGCTRGSRGPMMALMCHILYNEEEEGGSVGQQQYTSEMVRTVKRLSEMRINHFIVVVN